MSNISKVIKITSKQVHRKGTTTLTNQSLTVFTKEPVKKRLSQFGSISIFKNWERLSFKK